MTEEFILREVDIAKDAEKLAEMWKASDDQWPGTWSGGTEITPQMVTEWHDREKLINVYVFETDEKIVAYCSFSERVNEKNVGYVALLNVQPEYQGRSLGRQLLQKCIERCGDLGFHLLTLGTWSGNLKSVPLYKKTGFFWVPDTSVWMLDFVPGILNLPCAQPYFSKHDWYKTLRRELRQAEDDERWEEMKVFTYRWEEGADMLTVWADREAHTLTAVETNAFFAAAIAGNIEPAKGMPAKMRWQLKNKRDRPMSISLIASGTEHIKIDHRATETIAPGETRNMEATVEVAANTPDVERHKPVPAIRTLLVIDGEVLELGTGLRPQPAVEVRTAPEYVTLFPGVAKTVHLHLHSHLRSDIEATISLTPQPGLSTDWTERKVSIPAKSFAGLPVTLQAAEAGVHSLYATVYSQDGKTQPERVGIFCLPAGGILADKGAKETRIENEWTRVILRPRGGEMSLHSSQHSAHLGSFEERVGPPFWTSELDGTEYDIILDEQDGRVIAQMTADMNDYADLRVCRTVTIGGGPLIQIENSLANRGTELHKVQVSRNVYRMQQSEATITVPLAEGIVQSRRSEFPAAEEDISKKPEAFAERWVAVSSKQGIMGIIWEQGIVENELGWGAAFLTPELTCEPQTWMSVGNLYLYVGPGDWRTVRSHARRLAGTDGVQEPIPVEPRQVYDARLEPAPLVTVDDQVSATLAIDNLRSRPLEGKAKLELPSGVSVNRDAFEFRDVSIKTPLAERVILSFAPKAAAYEAKVSLQTRLFDKRITVPAIRLGNRSGVSVTEHESDGQSVYHIDNGRTQFAVAPAFSGALTSWQEEKTNHVLSPFPEQKTFGWMSPWYGGVTPLAMKPYSRELPGKLYQETFDTQPITLPDERGIPWRGVHLKCDIKREQLAGLQVELDYLTVGQSNLLKLIYRVHNTTTAKRRIDIGWFAFVQPGGPPANNTLRSEFVERKATPWETWSSAEHWGAAINPNTGHTMAMIDTHPCVRLIDWGDAGGHLASIEGVDVPPVSSTERTCYLVLCNDPETARQYVWLGKYT